MQMEVVFLQPGDVFLDGKMINLFWLFGLFSTKVIPAILQIFAHAQAQVGLKLEHKMKATVLSTGYLKQNGKLKHEHS